MCSRRAAGKSADGAAGILVPMGSTQPGKSRDEIRTALNISANGRYPEYMFSEVAYDEIVKGASR